MSTKNKNQNKMQSKRHILSTIHRLLELILRQIYLFFAFLKGPAQQQPPIKDLVLLNSATALASKIRNKQVNVYLSIHILSKKEFF